MNRLTAVALLVALSLSACKAPAPPAPPAAPAAPAAPQASVAPAPAAAKTGAGIAVASVDLGTDLGADNRITTALETFKPRDTIIAAVGIDNGASSPVDGSVGVRWTGPDGQAFNEEAQAKPYPPGAQSISFRVADPKGFKTGNYKIEVNLNGSTVQTKEFKIN
jgi:hypothetical protein